MRLVVAAILLLLGSSAHAFALSCADQITKRAAECVQKEGLQNARTCRAAAEAIPCEGGGSPPQASQPGIDTNIGLTETKTPLPPVVESAVSAAGSAIEFGSMAATCAALVERNRGLIASARAFEAMETKYLGPLGQALTAVKINNLRNKGQDAEAAQEAAGAVLDTVVCSAGQHVCASWMAGKTIGTLLSEGPKWAGITDRSVNEWWTDQLVEFFHPSPTEADFRRFEAAAKEKIARMKAEGATSSNCGGTRK